ncbi:MAG: hypothetical protein M3072_05845 [Candidatus Dormibacteraeota bacterium]|nr:hypothetical protein [Candidatus Dormibacteraeota bacterium]
MARGVGDDAGIVPYIDWANLGWAIPAGTARLTLTTVQRCCELGVEVASPGVQPG